MRPSEGSGVLASTPAARKAALFAHMEWWSRLDRETGRSDTTASMSEASGAPPS